MRRMTQDLSRRPPLLPHRWPDGDFFICDILDAAPKGDMASMEHPIFSISTKPDLATRRYESGPNFVEVQPSAKGLATVHDRDILIYCISQLMAAINSGREVKQTLRFAASELLQATNRPSGGESYRRLRNALDRLAGTRIVTNITTGNVEVLDGFGLIDRFKVIRETREGRMLDLEVTLSDWVFNAISHHEVLTLSRDYFRLRKPLERRLYEIARKHCGAQREWRIGMAKLKAKCGSNSTDKEFRRLISAIVREDLEHQHLPDYSIRLDEDARIVTFTSRGTVSSDLVESVTIPALDPDVYEMARQAAPGWDVRMIEGEWRSWATEAPKNPEMAFLGFCKKWFERRGQP